MTHRCAHCGIYYDDRTNVGRWLCRIHPNDGRIPDARPPALTCCGWKPDLSLFAGVGADTQRGCRLADHDVQPDTPPALVRAYVSEATDVRPAAILQRITSAADLTAVMTRYLPVTANAADVAAKTVATIKAEAHKDTRFYTWLNMPRVSRNALNVFNQAAILWETTHNRLTGLPLVLATIQDALAALRRPNISGVDDILNGLAQGMFTVEAELFVDMLLVRRVADATDALTVLELGSAKFSLDPLRPGDFLHSAPHSCLYYS
jgi:hypothetical protein